MKSLSAVLLQTALLVGTIFHLGTASALEPQMVFSPGASAVRLPGETAASILKRYKTPAANLNFGSGTSAVSEKKPLAQVDLSRLPEVLAPDLQPIFEVVRDTKPMLRASPHGGAEMARRASWLYPDDGCFTRAAIASESIQQLVGVKPAKVFIFGDLNVKTVNSPDGSVDWWYHVAAIVRVGNQAYVIDPALDPLKPFPIADWVAASSDPQAEVAICDGDAYDPFSECGGPTAGSYTRGVQEAGHYLDAEWYRLEDLGRVPEKELGDEPPWLAPVVLPAA